MLAAYQKILDQSSTDGRRKFDIMYNYSKSYENRQKVKSKGNTLQNCSFCEGSSAINRIIF